MKRASFIIIFLLKFFSSFSQDSLILHANTFTENLKVYRDSLGLDGIGEIPRNRKVFILAPGGKFMFKVYGNGVTGYASIDWLEYNKHESKKLNHNNIEWKILEAKRLDRLYIDTFYDKQRKDSIEAMNEAKKDLAKGLKDVLQVYSFLINRDTYKVGFGITVINYNKKSIKYVRFTILGYNDVGDIEQTKTFKGVGPIDFLTVGSYYFEDAFYSKVITLLKIKNISVEYMDGSKRDFTNIQLNNTVATSIDD